MAFERPPKCFKNDPQGTKSYLPPADLVRTTHTVVASGKGSKKRVEGWLKLEKQYGVPAANIIMLNFPGAVEKGKIVPQIVNWYLHHHRDFNCPQTLDGKNRIFKGGEKVAIPFSDVGFDDAEPLMGTIWSSGDVTRDRQKFNAAMVRRRYGKNQPTHDTVQEILKKLLGNYDRICRYLCSANGLQKFLTTPGQFKWFGYSAMIRVIGGDQKSAFRRASGQLLPDPLLIKLAMRRLGPYEFLSQCATQAESDYKRATGGKWGLGGPEVWKIAVSARYRLLWPKHYDIMWTENPPSWLP
jgi:hypothetical protein